MSNGTSKKKPSRKKARERVVREKRIQQKRRKEESLEIKQYLQPSAIQESAQKIAEAIYYGFSPSKIASFAKQIRESAKPDEGYLICYSERDPLGYVHFRIDRNEIVGNINYNVRKTEDYERVDRIHNELIWALTRTAYVRRFAVRLGFSDRWEPSSELKKKLQGVRVISKGERWKHPFRTSRELYKRKRVVKVRPMTNLLIIEPWGFKSRISTSERLRRKLVPVRASARRVTGLLGRDVRDIWSDLARTFRRERRRPRRK